MERMDRIYPLVWHDRKDAARSLIQLQYNVGKEPLEQLGMDITIFLPTNDLNALRERARLMAKTQERTADRFGEFNNLVQEDERFVETKIAAAEQSGKSRKSRALRLSSSRRARKVRRVAVNVWGCLRVDARLFQVHGRSLSLPKFEYFA